MRLELDEAEVKRAIEEHVRRVLVLKHRALSIEILDGKATVQIGDPTLAPAVQLTDHGIEPAEPTLVLS